MDQQQPTIPSATAESNGAGPANPALVNGGAEEQVQIEADEVRCPALFSRPC